MKKFDDLVWKPCSGDREVAEHPLGFFFVRPLERVTVVPISCPVCEVLYVDADDEVTHEEFECCSACADAWAYSRAKEWKLGWRPVAEDVVAEVKNRPMRTVKLG